MPQSYTQQQINWISNFQALVKQFLADANLLTAATQEYSSETFGAGGANAITDSVAQQVIPQATAAAVAGAEGAIVNILATITSNIGYLEAIVP